jgi:hypothetical protein
MSVPFGYYPNGKGIDLTKLWQSVPYHTYFAPCTIKVFPCNCTGACRTLGYCPSNPPAKPQALRPEDV